MFSWGYGFIIKIIGENGDNIAAVALIVASFNMLVQIFYSMVFGNKNNTKLRGSYRD